jgi:tRNA modification GTPase
MDLTEVEGLSDLLEAETALQRKQALRQMDGHMRVVFEGWRTDLISCLAHTEAVIDFGDDAADGDIDDSAMDPLIPRIAALRDEIEGHLADGRKGEIIRDGVRIALVGPPNAGKSSLMNALARRPAAIVSPVAGTTRDIIELRLDLAGVPCIVSDTAGLREGSEDPIELEGIRRAREALRRADVKVYVGDASDDRSRKTARDMFTSTTTAVSPESEEGGRGGGGDNEGVRLLVLNKVDVIDAAATDDTDAVAGAFQISCSTGVGIPELEAGLTVRIEELLERSTEEGALITRERHRAHMQACLVHLHGFLATTSMMDVASEELRLAMMELGKVTGRVDVEELLDVIFRDFCIGK